LPDLDTCATSRPGSAFIPARPDRIDAAPRRRSSIQYRLSGILVYARPWLAAWSAPVKRIRVTIVDAFGERAWSNPIWLD